MGGTEFVERTVRFEIMDMPSVPIVERVILSKIPQSPEDKEFARGDLERGVVEGVYGGRTDGRPRNW